jgi:hypothetical protein
MGYFNRVLAQSSGRGLVPRLSRGPCNCRRDARQSAAPVVYVPLRENKPRGGIDRFRIHTQAVEVAHNTEVKGIACAAKSIGSPGPLARYAIDLSVVPTIGCKLHYGLVILRLARRRPVWINVTANPTAEWVAWQIAEAFRWDEAPHHLIRDRDTSYGARVTRRLRTMGIRDGPITSALRPGKTVMSNG